MTFGNMAFGGLSADDLNMALQKTGSNYRAPATVQQGWQPGQALVQNPTQINDNAIRHTIAENNGMKARAEATSGGASFGKGGGGGGGKGGGFMGIAQSAMGMLGGGGGGGNGGQAMPQPTSNNPYSQARDPAAENQQKGMNRVGALLGAVGSFYTGNYAGMAGSINGLRSG